MKNFQTNIFPTLAVVLTCCCIYVGNVNATQALLMQDTYTSAATGQTTLNYNTGVNAFSLLVNGRAGNIRRSWMQFDLRAVLPSGTTWNQISRATLTVYVNSMVAPGTLRVERAVGAWTEDRLTNLVAPATGNDPNGSVYASARITAAGKYVAFDVTELVRDWVDGTAPNYGLVLVPADGTVQAAIDSKEATASSHPAVLDITLGGALSAKWHRGNGVPLCECGGCERLLPGYDGECILWAQERRRVGKSQCVEGSAGTHWFKGWNWSNWPARPRYDPHNASR